MECAYYFDFCRLCLGTETINVCVPAIAHEQSPTVVSTKNINDA